MRLVENSLTSSLFRALNENVEEPKDKEYHIEIWETDEDRDEGYGFIYKGNITNKDEAISEAKKIYDKMNYACVEVCEEEGDTVYHIDSDGIEEELEESARVTTKNGSTLYTNGTVDVNETESETVVSTNDGTVVVETKDTVVADLPEIPQEDNVEQVNNEVEETTEDNEVVEQVETTLHYNVFGDDIVIEPEKQLVVVNDKEISFERMDEISADAKRVNVIHKPAALLIYQDYKNNKMKKWEDSKVNDELKENSERQATEEIHKEKERDYKITDITELEPIDDGDVRAIDMNDILVDLDESLTNYFQNENAVVLNSYLTKKGKDYSSAIVDISAPNCNGYVLTFESAFDGKKYHSTIKETATNKKIERLCCVSKDPVKPFFNAVLEAINVSYKLKEHNSLIEDVEVICNEEPKEKDIINANDERVNKSQERFEKRVKARKKLLKVNKKFKIVEPDQKNTNGKIVEDKLDESVEEESTKDVEEFKDNNLTEEEMPKAIFHRNPNSVEKIRSEEEKGISTNNSSYRIINKKELGSQEFEQFANNLNQSYEWLKELYNVEPDATVFNCIEVVCNDKDYSILVDPNGLDYCRYVAIKQVNNEQEEKQTDEQNKED